MQYCCALLTSCNFCDDIVYILFVDDLNNFLTFLRSSEEVSHI
ncbi:hypothetical protein KL86CLO1_11065 [uncultured Eubacteriales bacterium]|uniref:Uncharacterized protein n=1 Tax=uncultured Eubacteriales bacterium TaxID=172733 RepID=A0A212JH92_9FIRM|nr:hypothetical protein KL86CLO1_11065 [uncultured Eubacteriales bacterium]